MDHAAAARTHLDNADQASPGYINDVANEATIDALKGIGHALLALNETLAKIQEDTYTVAASQ